MKPRISTPITVLKIVPDPPSSDAPPRMTAASTSSSSPWPTVFCAPSERLAWISPAVATQKAQIR
jgi:hypothetical protein